MTMPLRCYTSSTLQRIEWVLLPYISGVGFHHKQVFHLNINNLELHVEEFQEPVTCLAIRESGQGVGAW
jgi:hypothetical protein